MKKYYLFLLCIFLANTQVFSQQSIPFKIAPLGLNTGIDQNQDMYLADLSGDGSLTFEPSFQIGYEYYGKDNTSLKFIQGIGRDQMKKFYGFSQILLRYSFVLDKKNNVTLGIGPNFQFRNTWSSYSNYTDEGIFKTIANTQYKIFWLSGEIEYNHFVNRNFDFSISLNHTHPYTVAIFIGFKYYLTRKTTFCETCPSYH